jgi:branched-chain amino acid transport system substrate-binding protein
MKRILCMVTGVFAASMLFAAAPAFAKPDCGLNTGKAATGEPIPIGAVTSITGIATFHEADQGAEAYFKCVNANGGIHGRPIAYHEEDDQTKLDVAAQAAKKLVVDEGVYLLVGSTSLIECIANADQYLKANVLEIGLGIPPQCYQSKNIAEINAGPRASALGALDYARRKLGAKSLVCLIFKFPGSDYTCGGAEEWGKHFHVKVDSIYADPTSPDFGSLALQVLATGDDAVQALFVDDQAAQLLNSAEQQDGAAKMKWTGPTSYYTARFPGAIDTKYWNDRMWVNTELGPLDAKGRDNQNWNDVMDKYGPKVLKDSFSQAGYIAARIAVDAMLTIKDPKKINRNSVTAAVEVMKPYNTDILCGPWYWGGPGATEHQGNHITRTVVIHNGGFKFVEGCFPVADPSYAKSIIPTEEKLGINKKFDEEYNHLK